MGRLGEPRVLQNAGRILTIVKDMNRGKIEFHRKKCQEESTKRNTQKQNTEKSTTDSKLSIIPSAQLLFPKAKPPPMIQRPVIPPPPPLIPIHLPQICFVTVENPFTEPFMLNDIPSRYGIQVMRVANAPQQFQIQGAGATLQAVLSELQAKQLLSNWSP